LNKGATPLTRLRLRTVPIPPEYSVQIHRIDGSAVPEFAKQRTKMEFSAFISLSVTALIVIVMGITSVF
jgi:hypothetical protein